MTVIMANQLRSKYLPIRIINASLGFIYSTTDETLLEFFAVFIALIITVAAAVASIFIAVPTIVWSALKFIDATASRSE